MNFTFFSMTARKYKFTYVVHIIFLLDSTVLESLPCSQGTNNACWKHQANSEHLPTYKIKMPQGPIDPGCTCISLSLMVLMACPLCSVLITLHEDHFPSPTIYGQSEHHFGFLPTQHNVI